MLTYLILQHYVHASKQQKKSSTRISEQRAFLRV
nr:MAG TPA: hypothetical protein [Caudoviricetes sp.]